MVSIPKRKATRALAALVLGLGFGASGCDRVGVQVYQAPKDPPPERAANDTARSAPMPPRWTLPTGWQEAPPGPMQTAKFTAASDAGKIEITVSALAGDAGGRTANINRWRGQMGLPPVGEQEAAKSLIPLEVAGAASYAVELAAETAPRRMVVAGVSRDGQTWFYKLVGDDAAVSREKETFLKFVQSVNEHP